MEAFVKQRVGSMRALVNENAPQIAFDNEALRVPLMIDSIGALIVRFRPTNVSLDELSLEQGNGSPYP